MLDRNIRRSLGRGRGSTSTLPEGAVEQAVRLAQEARQGRALRGSHPLERADWGHPTPSAALRNKVLRSFDQMVALLTGDLGQDMDADEAGDARFDAAKAAVARAQRGLEEWVVEYAVTGRELPELPARVWRPAMRTMLQPLAAGLEDITLAELADAAATLGYDHSGDPDVDDVWTAIRAELVTEDDLADSVKDWTLTAMQARLVELSEADLLRALRAVQSDSYAQVAVLLLGLAVPRGMGVDVLPESVAHFATGEPLRLMHADPMWHAWGKRNLPPADRPRRHLDWLATSAAQTALTVRPRRWRPTRTGSLTCSTLTALIRGVQAGRNR